MVERLILVKHSLPVIDFTTPASHWILSEEGRRRANLLANRLERLGAGEIFSSREPKALETARLVSVRLRLPLRALDGLGEHQREKVRELSGDAFRRSVRALFDQPDQLVFGEETAGQACQRFSQAVEQALGMSRSETIMLVSHGTVISLFLAAKTGLDGFNLWQRLGLPAFAVVSLPGYVLCSVEAEVV